MTTGTLGKLYQPGEMIVRQGETGDCMYVIQGGEAEVLIKKGDADVCVGVLGEGDVFGEMALFEKEARSATVRASGEVRALALEKKAFLRRVHEDPSLAFRILEKMSKRIRTLDGALSSTLGRRKALR